MMTEAPSGFIDPGQADVSRRFEEMTAMPCRGHNVLVRARRYGRWWVLKGLKPELRNKQLYRTMLRKEFDILVSLQHPNVITATGFEEVEGLGWCIVMEWVDGTTLDKWLVGHSRRERMDVLNQLLDALQYIHGKQIAHRDLKPSNIMVTHNGNHVKLIDFGLSDTDDYDILKMPAGSAGFIAPEQTKERKTDIRNDIFSLGKVMETMGLGRSFAHIIKRCEAPIGQRYANVQELRHDVRSRSSQKSIAAVIVIGLVMTTFGVYVFSHKTPETIVNHKEAVADTVKAVAEKAKTKDSTKVSADAAKAMSRDEKLPATSPKITAVKTAEYIEKGKREIDRMWKQSGTETTADIIKKSELFTAFVEKSNAFVTTTYPATLPQTMASAERNAIVSELSKYATELYIQPTLNALKSAQQ